MSLTSSASLALAVASTSALVACGSSGGAGASPLDAGAGADANAPDANDAAPEPHPLAVEWRRAITCTSNVTWSSGELAVDPSGDAIHVGFMGGACNVFGGDAIAPATRTIVLAKLASADGARTWGRTIGDADPLGTSGGIGVSPSGIAFAGWFSGDVDFGTGALHATTIDGTKTDLFVAALDASGNARWAKSFATDGIFFGAKLAADPSGGIVLAGQPTRAVDLGGGPVDGALGAIVVAKLDAGGAHRWSKRFGGLLDASAQLQAVGADASGASVIVGTFTGSLDFGGGALKSHGKTALFVAKLDADGAHVQSRAFPCSTTTCRASVAVDADGAFALAGVFAGTLDVGDGAPLQGDAQGSAFALRFDAAGALSWKKVFLASDWVRVAIAPSHDVVVSITFAGALDLDGASWKSAGRRDTVLAAFKPDGARAWAQRFGGEWDDTVDALAVAPDGALLVEGAGEIGGTPAPREIAFAAKLRLATP